MMMMAMMMMMMMMMYILLLLDDRRDHETYAGGLQQETERVGTDQGGETKPKVKYFVFLYSEWGGADRGGNDELFHTKERKAIFSSRILFFFY